jgi:hypothetical protein
MGQDQVASAVTRFYAALRANDVDAWVSLFAADVTARDPEGAPPHQGLDGLRDFLSGVLRRFETFGLRRGGLLRPRRGGRSMDGVGARKERQGRDIPGDRRIRDRWRGADHLARRLLGRRPGDGGHIAPGLRGISASFYWKAPPGDDLPPEAAPVGPGRTIHARHQAWRPERRVRPAGDRQNAAVRRPRWQLATADAPRRRRQGVERRGRRSDHVGPRVDLGTARPVAVDLIDVTCERVVTRFQQPRTAGCGLSPCH